MKQYKMVLMSKDGRLYELRIQAKSADSAWKNAQKLEKEMVHGSANLLEVYEDKGLFPDLEMWRQ